MATETLQIRVREDGSRVVSRNIRSIGTSAKVTEKSVDFLKATLLSLGGAFSIREATKYLDISTRLENRLRVTGVEGKELKAVYQALLETSNATFSSFEATTELYARLALSSRELGVSQKDLVGFTKTLNQSIILSGATALEAEQGLIQLAQGMASGTLRGDELRSVLEQLPMVADIIADGMGVTRGELRGLGADGKITGKVIVDAFREASDTLDGKFGKNIITVAQATQVFKNTFIDLVGQVREATGINEILADILLTLAANMKAVASASIAMGVAIATAFAPSVIQSFIAHLKTLFAIIRAHPLMAIATALAGIITYVTLMRHEFLLGIDDFTSLGDLMSAVIFMIKEAYAAVKADSNFMNNMMGQISTAFTTFGTSFVNFVVNIITVSQALGRQVQVFLLARLRDIRGMLVQWFEESLHAVGRVTWGVFKILLGGMHSLFRGAASGIKDELTQVLEGVGNAFNNFLLALGNIASGIGEWFSQAFDRIWEDITLGVKQTLKVWDQEFNSFFAGTGKGLAGFLRSVARVIDRMEAFLMGSLNGLKTFFDVAPELLIVAFKKAVNAAAGLMEDFYNGIVGGINKIAEFAGAEGRMDELFLPKMDVVEGRGLELGDRIATSIQEGFDKQGGFWENKLNVALDLAIDFGLARKAKQALSDISDEAGELADQADKNKKEWEKFLKMLEKLLRKLFPIQAAMQDQAKDLAILERAYKANLITLDKYAEAIERVHQSYADAIDPMGAWRRELEEETNAYNMSVSDRSAYREALDVITTLREKGLDLSSKEKREVFELIQAHEKLGAVAAAEESIYGKFNDRRTAVKDETQAIQNLLGRGEISQTEGRAAAAGILESEGLDTTLFDAMIAHKEQKYKELYGTIADLEQKGLLSHADAERAKLQVSIQKNAAETAAAKEFFGGLANLQSANVKFLFDIGKAAAITQAVINTHEAATKAIAQGGVFGPAMAAGAIAAGAAQVAQIASQRFEPPSKPGFAVGGEFTVPGPTGGVDSQLVAFRASPGERVQVRTPEQVRRGTGALEQGASGGDMKPIVNLKNVNVLDPSLVGDYLTTDSGEQTLINAIQNNRETIKRALES